MIDVVVTIGGFLALLLLIVSLRIRTKSKLEVRTGDVVLALIPVALWLLVTGKVKAIEVGDVRVESAITEASRTDLSADLMPLPVEEITPGPKGPISGIDELIEQRSKALSFRLGHAQYIGFAIRDYLLELTDEPFLKYVVILEGDDVFFGMADARQMAELIRRGSLDPDAVARWLNDAEGDALIEKLPGFLGAGQALPSTASRREALERMNNLEVEILPVVDVQGSFVGVVQRSNLTASMLIDIVKKD